MWIRYDLSLPHAFSHPPAPGRRMRDLIPRQPSGLYMRGEEGVKRATGSSRPITAHHTTHLDAPRHFFAEGADMAALLNDPQAVVDRFCHARVVCLAPREGALQQQRNGLHYRERVDAVDLPSVECLRGYEALILCTGFGAVMARHLPQEEFPPLGDGGYHEPWLAEDAVEQILEAGLRLVAIDAPSVEPQTSVQPYRMGSEVHRRLLGHTPAVLIAEGLNCSALAPYFGGQAEDPPQEGLLQLVPQRSHAADADAAPCRALFYSYDGPHHAEALRSLHALFLQAEYRA